MKLLIFDAGDLVVVAWQAPAPGRREFTPRQARTRADLIVSRAERGETSDLGLYLGLPFFRPVGPDEAVQVAAELAACAFNCSAVLASRTAPSTPSDEEK